MSHKHNGFPELVFAALSQGPPPPIDDAPPLHVFTMSIGVMIGRLLEQGKFKSDDVVAACNWIAGKKTTEEVIRLIWNI